ncbi:MAG: hypothetical protein K0A95_11535, partial [Chromatiales bacterium]|nr:hypothetical protein [Chromatiales bacterium]
HSTPGILPFALAGQPSAVPFCSLQYGRPQCLLSHSPERQQQPVKPSLTQAYVVSLAKNAKRSDALVR